MKSTILVLLGGLAFVCPALAAPADRPSAPPASAFKGDCESDSDGAKFAAKVCYTRFAPGNIFEPSNTKYSAGYQNQPPTCDKSRAISAREKDLLAKTYARAPDYMKTKLCRLTQVFVTKASSAAGENAGSWGFWQPPPQSGVYIGISEQVLKRPGGLEQHEHEVWRRLLNLNRITASLLPRVRTDNASDPTTAILAQLAHELGHVLLADTNADGADDRHPRRELVGPPRSACFDDAFLRASWDADLFHRKMRRWVRFGDQNGNRPTKVDFVLQRLRAKGRTAIAAVRVVTHSNQFVSLVAASSPEEDFVETYKYKILTDSAPNLTIRRPVSRTQVKASDLLAGDVIAGKVGCLRDLGLLTP